MRKFALSVDRFFYQFIEDEPSRAFFLHLPFWSLSLWISWYVLLHSGLWLLWVAVTLIVAPVVLSALSMEIYKTSQHEPTMAGGWITMFRAWCAAYVCLVCTLIGIPGLYFGLILQVVQTNMFANAYWWVITFWWKLFHVYQTDYNMKDMRAFLTFYGFQYVTWQWCFLVSAVAIAPSLFGWLYLVERTDRRVRASEAEAAAEKVKDDLKKAEINKAKAETEKLRAEAGRVELEKKRQAAREAEAEEKRKHEAKINEVKGKDPWDSGFL